MKKKNLTPIVQYFCGNKDFILKLVDFDFLENNKVKRANVKI